MLLRQSTFGRGVEAYPAYSPDGVTLAFCGVIGGFQQILLKDLETDMSLQTTTIKRDHIQPAWSPDGAYLIFVRATEPRTFQ